MKNSQHGFIAIVVIIVIVIIAGGIYYVSRKNSISNSNTMSNEHQIRGKILAPQQIALEEGSAQYKADNNPEHPSRVVKMNGANVLWNIELAKTEINTNLEEDVQLQKYFVSKMEVKDHNGKPALFVTVGKDVNAKTYVLDLKTGNTLDIIIVSPPSVS